MADAVMAQNIHGWLWSALGLPMREDGTYPDQSARFRLATIAQHHLPRDGWVTIEEVRRAFDAAKTEYAIHALTSSLNWTNTSQVSFLAAESCRREAFRIDGQWAHSTDFKAGWDHPTAHLGGMRSRDLTKKADLLDRALQQDQFARRSLHLAQRLKQTAEAARAAKLRWLP